MDHSQELTAIRCPNPRPHQHYEICGHLLGALNGKTVLVYCEVCKTFYEIEICENGNIFMHPMSKNTKLNMKTSLRAIE